MAYPKNRKSPAGVKASGFRHGACCGNRPTPLYQVWNSMRSRCLRPQHKSYPRYGGRGINICGQWDSFPAFAEWANDSGYASGRFLDRIDNEGPYSPENCRWADAKTQARNRSNNRMLTYRGKTAPLSEHAEDAGLRPLVPQQRLKLGWSIDRAFGTPVKKRSRP